LHAGRHGTRRGHPTPPSRARDVPSRPRQGGWRRHPPDPPLRSRPAAARPLRAVAIAKALGISVSELAGTLSHRVNLSGDWWTCWQTSRGGVEDIRTQPVHLDQHGELIQIEATARGRPVEEGGYLWRGELRLWDNEILMGWYAAGDGSVRSKDTMYFVMHPHGIHATGRWVGLSYDGNSMTGWSSMARTEDEARNLVDELKEQDASGSR
jgi:hypothetical protein